MMSERPTKKEELYDAYIKSVETLGNQPDFNYTEPIRVVSKAEWEWYKEHYPADISEEDGVYRFNGLRIIVQRPLPTGTFYTENKKDAQIKRRCEERLAKTLGRYNRRRGR